MSHFHVETITEAGPGALRLHGELDVASSVVLEEELVKLGAEPRIVLDLTRLEFVDSSGIGVLFKSSQQISEQGRQFVLVKGAGQVADMLELTGLADRLQVIDSLTDLPADG